MISEEQKFNSCLKAEIDQINQSLARINSLVNVQKVASERGQQNLLESQNPNDISMELKAKAQSVRVHDAVSSHLFKTMTKWNSMILDLQESTDFDYEKVSMSFQQEAQSSRQSSTNNLLLRMSSVNTDRSSVANVSQAPSTMSRGKYCYCTCSVLAD